MHYNKVLLNDNPVQMPNSEVEFVLAMKILSGDFAIEMDYTDQEGNVGVIVYGVAVRWCVR